MFFVAADREALYSHQKKDLDYTVEMTSRLKGLDLIDRVLEELWTYQLLFLHCTGGGDQNHSQEKEIKKAKRLFEWALQIAEKRREIKGKGERERYAQLNAEFQRIAGRDKKAFLSDQCKEIEENNRMGKTRDLFNKIRDTKATFHSMMGTIKDKNCKDLAEAEEIKKRWQEYRTVQKTS